jgi:SWIM zinc finger
MSSLRETLELQLARFDDDAFASLANRGLLRRARKDLEKETPEIVEESSTRIVIGFGGQRIEFDSRGPTEARCTCPTRSGCQHILAAAIALASLAPKATGAVPEGTITPGDKDLRQPLIQALLGLTPQALRKHSGKAGYRWAWQFVQDLDIENDLTLAGERNIIITFRHPPVTFRYMGGSVDALLSDADVKQVAKYRVAAVLAFQRASGQMLEQPEETTSSTASLNLGKDHAPDERGSAALSEQRARLLAAVHQLARECVTLGLAHASSGIHERFATLAVWAQGAQLYRLALLLRRIADHVDMLLERAGGADEQRLFDELTLAYALASALETAAEEGKSPATLVGRARTEYEEVGPLELLGLGTSAWRSASGYLGLTMLFWSPSQQTFLSCTDARPEMQRFDPVARYKAAGPWSGLGAPAVATGRKIMLTGAMLSAGGRISASEKTHATLMPANATSFIAALKVCSRWTELTLERSARRRSLLAEPQPLKDWVVLRPKSLRRPEFDAARQTLRWALLDDQENVLNAEVPFDTYTAPVIERLELFEPGGEVLVVARLRGGSSDLVAEPLSVVDSAASGAAAPVDSLYFDPAPKTGMVGKLLAKLRRRADSAEAASTRISPIPKLLTEVKRCLALQAERGLAGDSATAALDQLRGRLKRLVAAGFSAFGGASDADAAIELLQAHYLCLQYEHLIDDSVNEAL